MPAVDAAGLAAFAPVSRLINDAIAAERLPGAVVVVGHGGKIVFHQAYGSRKLAGEQGLDGVSAPAEPMTEDTIFDIASLTKCLATATAIMQLYEQGKVGFDDPVQNHLPGFNPASDPQRAQVTVRMLLTQTSGEPVDVGLQDAWGLDGADRAEGIHRALSTPLQSPPGREFRYSDINYILLGALLEKIAGEAEDGYVAQHVFAPIGMQDSDFLPAAKACGPHSVRGAAIGWAPAPAGRPRAPCPAGTWDTALLSHIAPTALDEESGADPSRNPNFNRLLRGTVHDPTARRMGGSGRARRGVLHGARCQQLRAGPARSSCGPPQHISTDAGDVRIDDDPAAARTSHGATGRRERRGARSACAPAELNRSDAGSALSGDQRTNPVWVRLGYRHAIFRAAGRGLSHRQLRWHRLHRNFAVDRPGFRQLCGSAVERNSSAGQHTDFGPAWTGGYSGRPGAGLVGGGRRHREQTQNRTRGDAQVRFCVCSRRNGPLLLAAARLSGCSPAEGRGAGRRCPAAGPWPGRSAVRYRGLATVGPTAGTSGPERNAGPGWWTLHGWPHRAGSPAKGRVIPAAPKPPRTPG